MINEKSFYLQLRSQQLQADAHSRNQWETVTVERIIPACKTAILICDIWDQHWSRGASERVEAMVPRINFVIQAARQVGALILHAPSETMPFYESSPARRRMQELPPVQPPRNHRHSNPRLPVDDSDGGSDTGERTWFKAWTRQHPAIQIDEERDGISDNGLEIYTFLQAHAIEQLLICGVHTNMCVLNRSFAIKQMVRWGVPIALMRDLTDAMYNPARAPYVDHAEGTRLIIEFIEKFWCPTILSDELIAKEN